MRKEFAALVASMPERVEGEVVLRLLRPMLGVWRGELDEWIAERGLTFCEDLSNADPRWARNRIRHGLLPELERMMERPVKAALWRTAEVLRAEADWLREHAAAGGELQDQLEVRALRVLAVSTAIFVVAMLRLPLVFAVGPPPV